MKKRIKDWLLWTQQYTKIDMLYVAKGGTWSSFNFILNSALSLLLVVAFANLIPREIYGNYKYIMSVAGAAGFLLFTGVRTTVVQAVARGLSGALIYGVKLQLKLNALFFLSMGLGAAYYFIKGNTTLAYSLFILGVAMPLDAAFSTYGSFLTGRKEFKRNAVYSMWGGLINIVPMIGVLFLTNNVITIVITYGFLGMFSSFLFYKITTARFNIPKTIPKEEEKKIFSYSMHLSVTNIFSTIAQNIDKIVLFQYLGAIQVAVYSLAGAIPSRINGFVKSIGTIALPKLSERSMEEINAIFYKRVGQGAVIGGLMSLGYILLSPFVFKLILPQYLDSIFYSQLLSLNFIPIVIANYIGNVFYAQKLIGAIYKSSVTANIARIALYVIFGALWGIIGVVAATLLTYYLGIVLNLIIWNSEIKKMSL